MHKHFAVFLFVLVTVAADARAVTIAWSAVGNPSNAADTTGFGAVGYSYNIGTYDVTNSQYVEFLNAKDSGGLNLLSLYDSNMSDATYGGIHYSAGSASGSKYTVISGDGNHPVNSVTWYDAIRFANWMNNGQGNGSTETGTYTLGPLGAGGVPINGDSIMRNAGATVFLPSVDEWYKAAFFNPAANSYFDYSTSSNTAPTASSPTALPNHANFAPDGPHNLTDIGAYTGTTSPYGAFDMGGNVEQWNEAPISDTLREARGASFAGISADFLPTTRTFAGPANEFVTIGFRLASVPEPSSIVLAALGLVSLAAWGWRRRASHR